MIESMRNALKAQKMGYVESLAQWEDALKVHIHDIKVYVRTIYNEKDLTQLNSHAVELARLTQEQMNTEQHIEHFQNCIRETYEWDI